MSETRKEEFKVNGETLLAKVKELIKEGNVRRITMPGGSTVSTSVVKTKV